jgi:hypothetical protein
MPWEMPSEPASAAASPGEDSMPWETAPAATQAAPEAEGWSGAGQGGAAEQQEEAAEDDEDLEMFRSWLQSLKK